MKFILVRLFMLIKEMIIDIWTQLKLRAKLEDIKKEKEKLNDLTTKDSVIDSELDDRLAKYRLEQIRRDKNSKLR